MESKLTKIMEDGKDFYAFDRNGHVLITENVEAAGPDDTIAVYRSITSCHVNKMLMVDEVRLWLKKSDYRWTRW